MCPFLQPLIEMHQAGESLKVTNWELSAWPDPTVQTTLLPSIKFETEISDSHVHFLDTTVSLDSTNNSLSTSLYTKPTDAHNYLSYTSCHPRNCKSAIPYSQFLRLRRICSKEEDFLFHAKQMASHFLTAKYPSDVIQKGFSKAYHTDRNTLLITERSLKTDEEEDSLSHQNIPPWWPYSR